MKITSDHEKYEDAVYFLRMAYEVADDFATDPSTQNGAILVDSDGHPFSEGANHFPNGVEEKTDRWERPGKYLFVEHAERNVIYAAARAGFKTDKATMYCPWAACTDCARAIIQAGIKEVITHHKPVPDSGERFGMPVHPKWSESINVALLMLEEAGVNINWVEDKLYKNDELRIRFNEQLISP